MKTITFFIALIFSQIILAQTWTQLPDFNGNQRSNAMAFELNGKGYLGFGQFGSTYFNDIWEYDPQNATWSLKGVSLASGRRQGVAFSIDSLAYIGLGRSSTTNDFNDFWRYDPNLNSWTQLSNYPGKGKFLCYYGVANNEAYIAGGIEISGSSNSYSSELWKYNATAGTWTQLSSIPFGPRAVGASTVVGDSLLVMACGHNGSVASKDFWVYNTVTTSWTLLPTFPGLARIVPVLFSYQNKLIVGGGSVLNSSNVLSDWYEFDFSNNTWSSLSGFTAGQRSRTPDFTINGLAYIVTGADATNSETKDFWRYGLATKTKKLQGEVSYFKVFPNPSFETLNIESKFEINELRIYSPDGKQVYLNKSNGLDKSMSIQPELSSGIYFIEVITSKGMETKQIVVE